MSPRTTLSIEDDRAIRDLIVRYSDGICLPDTSILETAWTADCRLLLISGQIVGRDAVIALQMEHMARYESLLQLIGEGMLWAVEGGAAGRWVVWEMGRRSGSEEDRMGVVTYSDQYVKEDGRWAIAERQVRVHYNNETIPAGTFKPLEPLPPRRP